MTYQAWRIDVDVYVDEADPLVYVYDTHNPLKYTYDESRWLWLLRLRAIIWRCSHPLGQVQFRKLKDGFSGPV